MTLLKRISSFWGGESRTANLKKNILASFGIKGISILVSLLLVPLTIDFLSPELYGVWLSLSAIYSWISFLDIGFSQGLKNRLAEAIAKENWEQGRKLVSTTYCMMIIIFVPVCFFMELALPYINWCKLLNISFQYGSEVITVIRIIIFMTCVQMVINVIVSVIAAFQKVALSNAFSVLGNVLALGAIYILTKTYHSSLPALALSMTFMPVVVTFIASIILYNGRFKGVAPNFSYMILN